MSATPMPSHGVTRRQVITTGALTIAALAAPPSPALASTDDAISRTEEAIHQVRVFAAARKHVYEALTVETRFDKVVQLSGVMKADSMAHSPSFWLRYTRLATNAHDCELPPPAVVAHSKGDAKINREPGCPGIRLLPHRLQSS